MWSGLLVGLIEIAHQACRRFCFDAILWRPVDKLWIAPVTYAALFAALALLVVGVGRLGRRSPNWIVVLAVLAGTAAWSQVLLAESKLKRESQAAFVDDKAKRELRLAISELQLKQTERDYAADLLSRTTLRATQSGIAVFTSKKDWKGKPVSAGERIMQIADPARVESEVRLPIGDAIELPPNGRVKLFLASDPLNARSARIVHVSHEATPDAANILSYRVVARLSEPDKAVPRIGEHGTAQLLGDKVPLFYYLFRRPITAVRQHTGL